MTDQPRSTVPRPHHRWTEDGRRVREVLTYARRGARFSPSQGLAWETYHERWWIPEDAVDRPSFDLASWFGRRAPLVVEIGSGVGEATAPLALARPDCNVLAIEVWRPGVASTLGQLGEAGVDNVRLLGVDAVWVFAELLSAGDVAELWSFFPDPWPKTRHRKRRLVTPENVGLLASRLRPDGTWRLATDWPDYAAQMRRVLDGEPLLAGGEVDRWAERPVTKFERKGRDAGRPIVDLAYRRVG